MFGQSTQIVPATPLNQDIWFPPKLQCLFKPMRYKVLYGGRGAAKSWGVARALLLLGSVRPIRILCVRELQKSIKDSVHKLLADQIRSMGLSHLYDVLQAEIRGKVGTAAEGTTFSFEGIRLNSDGLKSYEGVDICWVEEAQNVSAESWKDLIPTIRKKNSNIHGIESVAEIWVTFNPDLDTDATYVRFVKRHPSNSIVEKMNYRDNPWFADPMLTEMLDLKRDDFDEYLHVWEGECQQNLKGAVYADEMRDATTQNRIRDISIGGVPHDRGASVDVIFDLGHGNHTSLWFKQTVAWEHRFVDYYQNRLQQVDHYVSVIKNRGYVIGTVWLPHDGAARRLGTKMTIEEQLKEHGFTVRIVPKLSITDGINAAKTIFPTSYFDANKCADGLTCLRRYRYEIIGYDENRQPLFSKDPVHDEYSDGADAFRYAGVVSKMGAKKKGGLKLRIPGLTRSEAESQGASPAVALLSPVDRERSFFQGGQDKKTGWLL